MSEITDDLRSADAPLRIVLVDDHPVVRMGMRVLLESEGMEVVGEASDGQSAVDVVTVAQPDVVLMDLRMPIMDGATATSQICRANPAARVLVLTTFDNDTEILRAVEAGAVGYLLKDAPQDELVLAIRAAKRGETVLSPSVAAKLVNHMRAPVASHLTARELDVLRALITGGTNADIGRELFISEATVKTHLLRVFAKLGVDDRTAAVTVAMQRGLIALP